MNMGLWGQSVEIRHNKDDVIFCSDSNRFNLHHDVIDLFRSMACFDITRLAGR